MTDRERRLIDAATEARNTLEQIYLNAELTQRQQMSAVKSIILIGRSINDYFGSERQDT